MAPRACRDCQALLEKRGRLETWGPWVPTELQVLGVPTARVGQRALQGCVEELASPVLWARRVSQGRLETQDSPEPQASQGPRENLVKRGTQAHLGLQDPQARRAPLEKMEPKGTWAPEGSQEIQDPLETLEFRV